MIGTGFLSVRKRLQTHKTPIFTEYILTYKKQKVNSIFSFNRIFSGQKNFSRFLLIF